MAGCVVTANHTTEIDAIRRALGPGLAYAAAHAALDSLVTALTTAERELHSKTLRLGEVFDELDAAERRAQEAEERAAKYEAIYVNDRLGITESECDAAVARADTLTRRVSDECEDYLSSGCECDDSDGSVCLAHRVLFVVATPEGDAE